MFVIEFPRKFELVGRFSLVVADLRAPVICRLGLSNS